MGKSLQLTDAMNDLGNALTAAQWPVSTVKDPVTGHGVRVYDTKIAYKELVTAVVAITNQESTLRDCVNELCLKCGSYRERHRGACDGCRWLDVQKEVQK